MNGYRLPLIFFLIPVLALSPLLEPVVIIGVLVTTFTITRLYEALSQACGYLRTLEAEDGLEQRILGY